MPEFDAFWNGDGFLEFRVDAAAKSFVGDKTATITVSSVGHADGEDRDLFS